MRNPGEAEARFAEARVSWTDADLRSIGVPERNFDRARELLTGLKKVAPRVARLIR